MKLLSILKPEYLYRPRQIFRRIRFQFSRHGEFADATLPWGMPIRVRPGEALGKSILSLGLFELPVTEAIWRLVDPGDTVADVGANIGYMTAVIAHRVRPGGTVVAFEPHPEIYAELTHNVRLWERDGRVTLSARHAAVSDHSGTCELNMPAAFSINRGLASLERREGAGVTKVSVPQVSLDDAFSRGEKLGLVKVDVEGHEASVFAGARTLITEKRVRDWLFEENNENPHGAARMLEENGYTLFRLNKHFTPASLPAPVLKVVQPDYAVPESPNFLATLEPDRARARFQQPKWHALRPSA